MKKNNNTPSLSREGRGGSQGGSSGGSHKKPWQETYATPEEIKAMLDSRVSLRYNEVRGRPEIHWLSAGPVLKADERGLPPQLRAYFYTKTDSAMLTKDDRLVLAQYGLVCWEELDSMLPKELNKMKGTMTMPSINERRAYGRYHESLPHLASFCGTGNNVQFLSDTTGTRRWLPFEVDSIESPLTSPFDYDAIYAQAYALYQQGFRYWFDRSEIERLQRHNETYTTSNDEEDLVGEYFRLPRGAETGEFMRTAVAKQLLSAPGMNLSTVALGRAFTHLGFKAATVNHNRGYYVVRILPEERKQRAVSLAYDAMKKSQATNTDDTDGTDVF